MRFSIFSLLFVISFSISAQKRIAIYDVQRAKGTATSLSEVSGYIVGNYASDDRFIVIDKANSQLIRNEQDRQKSEEFIDGYIVEQGVQEGYDYCFYPRYDSKEKVLEVKVYDVAKGTVISSQRADIKTGFLKGPKNVQEAVNELINKVNTDCFEIRYEILRATKEKKGKAKELLFAIGYNQRAEEKQIYDIYQLVEEKVGGKTLQRKDILGYGEIDRVEDGNFSYLKVTKHGDKILSVLKAGQPLYGAIHQK